MDAAAWIAEQRIREAMEEGLFDDLPSHGKPLPEGDDEHVPDERRLRGAAWRLPAQQQRL